MFLNKTNKMRFRILTLFLKHATQNNMKIAKRKNVLSSLVTESLLIIEWLDNPNHLGIMKSLTLNLWSSKWVTCQCPSWQIEPLLEAFEVYSLRFYPICINSPSIQCHINLSRVFSLSYKIMPHYFLFFKLF